MVDKVLEQRVIEHFKYSKGATLKGVTEQTEAMQLAAVRRNNIEYAFCTNPSQTVRNELLLSDLISMYLIDDLSEDEIKMLIRLHHKNAYRLLTPEQKTNSIKQFIVDINPSSLHFWHNDEDFPPVSIFVESCRKRMVDNCNGYIGNVSLHQYERKLPDEYMYELVIKYPEFRPSNYHLYGEFIECNRYMSGCSDYLCGCDISYDHEGKKYNFSDYYEISESEDSCSIDITAIDDYIKNTKPFDFNKQIDECFYE